MAAYEKTAWEDTTPLHFDTFNHMEDGIEAAQATADTALAAATGGVGSAVVVAHGADPATARPVTDGAVVWVGTVAPANINAGSGDAWIDPDKVGLDTEAVQDLINSTILAGTNVTKTYDDAAGTVTISATGGGGGGSTALFARKTADTQSISTADTDDPHLTVAAAANTIYIVEGFLRYEAATTGDIKVRLLAPSGAAVEVMYLGAVTGTSGTGTAVNVAVDSFARPIGGAGAGNDMGIVLHGSLVMGSSAGNVRLSWSQTFLDTANPTILYTNSWIRLTPVG